MKILAADDERVALDFLTHQLQRLPVVEAVHPFVDPFEILDFLKQHTADVAILATEMMGMSGLELAMRAKMYRPALKVIFVTSFCASADGPYIQCSRGNISKPVTIESLEEALSYVQAFRPDEQQTRLRTFGQFDLLVQGKPVAFAEPLSKEILAYLVFRRGQPVRYEALGTLVGHEKGDGSSIYKRLINAISSLERDLKGLGLSPILRRIRDHLQVNFANIACDLNDFLRGDPDAINGYEGAFMTQYPWARMTFRDI